MTKIATNKVKYGVRRMSSDGQDRLKAIISEAGKHQGTLICCGTLDMASYIYESLSGIGVQCENVNIPCGEFPLKRVKLNDGTAITQTFTTSCSLETALYTGETDPVERESIKARFDDQNDKLNVIVATTAACTGLDLQRCDCVIVLNRFFGFCDFVQALNRCARNRTWFSVNRPGTALWFLDDSSMAYYTKLNGCRDATDSGDIDIQRLAAYANLKESDCRRQFIGINLMETDARRCGPSDAACDLCEANGLHTIEVNRALQWKKTRESLTKAPGTIILASVYIYNDFDHASLIGSQSFNVPMYGSPSTPTNSLNNTGTLILAVQ